jgi:hypothetical protein
MELNTVLAVMPAIKRGFDVGVLFAFVALQNACSSPTLPERYAHCEDLGTLRLESASIDDAEDRMRAQVAIMGGDLLLFSARGHSEVADTIPPPLAQRRNALAATPAESINGRQPALEALTASAAKAADTQKELWYYGAALRCKPLANTQ